MDELKELLVLAGVDFKNYWSRVLKKWYHKTEDFLIRVFEDSYGLMDGFFFDRVNEVKEYYRWQFSFPENQKLDFYKTLTQFIRQDAFFWHVTFSLTGIFCTVWLAIMWQWYDYRTYRLRDPFVLPFGPDFLYSDAQKTKWHKRGTIFTFWVGYAYMYYGDNLDEHGWISKYMNDFNV